MALPTWPVTGTVGLARLIHDRPDLVTGPLAATPRTFLHGDWKMGNLGTHPDGRTILLDWAYPGSGPACWDLCWYLALNRARLPEPKQAAIGRFRAALEASGVATGSWWDAQLDLCLIAIMATFGWEKACSASGTAPGAPGHRGHCRVGLTEQFRRTGGWGMAFNGDSEAMDKQPRQRQCDGQQQPGPQPGR